MNPFFGEILRFLVTEYKKHTISIYLIFLVAGLIFWNFETYFKM